MKIKICGLRRQCDIDYANELLPDFIGFIFDKTRRRYIEPAAAAKLKQNLDGAIKAVGVFVDEPLTNVVNCAEIGAMDIIQLHGNEDEAYISALRKKTDCPIIKAFKIKCAADIANAEKLTADYLLFDSGQGSGKVFDWDLLKAAQRPYFLAGGLNTDNVKTAVEILHPFGVDVSSGVETAGYKDYEKMKRFVEICRENDD